MDEMGTPGEGTRPTSPAKPPSCRPGAPTRRPHLVHNENCWEHIRHGEVALIPASQDRFKTTEWFMPEANFLRDSSNRVSAVTLGGGRVAAIRFNRKVSIGAGAAMP